MEHSVEVIWRFEHWRMAAVPHDGKAAAGDTSNQRLCMIKRTTCVVRAVYDKRRHPDFGQAVFQIGCDQGFLNIYDRSPRGSFCPLHILIEESRRRRSMEPVGAD